ncbi:MAG: hypothetical protein WCO33_03805 [bacterium]
MTQESELSTLNQLKKQDTENVVGSPIVKREFNGVEKIKQRVLEGKKYSFYEDGSVQIDDEVNGVIHYITKEGLIKRKERLLAKSIIEADGNISNIRKIGSGVSGVVRELTDEIAVKLVNHKKYASKEKDRINPKYINKNSTVNVLHLNMIFRKLNIKHPEDYGFSVKKGAKGSEIQEYQFMEYVHRPTLDQILRPYFGAGTRDPKYEDFINNIIKEASGGNDQDFYEKLYRKFNEFVHKVMEQIPGIYEIGNFDNAFLLDYKKETDEFDFMIIDPALEQLILRITVMDDNRLRNALKRVKLWLIEYLY